MFNRYDDISIKFLESKWRAKRQIKIVSSSSTKITMNYKDFFVNLENQLQLVQFLCKNAPSFFQVNDNNDLYFCGGYDDPTICMKIQGCTFSKQICACFLIFHVVKIQSEDIIILNADTDVFVLGTYFWHKLAQTGCRGLCFYGPHKKKNVLHCQLFPLVKASVMSCLHYTP